MRRHGQQQQQSQQRDRRRCSPMSLTAVFVAVAAAQSSSWLLPSVVGQRSVPAAGSGPALSWLISESPASRVSLPPSPVLVYRTGAMTASQPRRPLAPLQVSQRQQPQPSTAATRPHVYPTLFYRVPVYAAGYPTYQATATDTTGYSPSSYHRQQLPDAGRGGESSSGPQLLVATRAVSVKPEDLQGGVSGALNEWWGPSVSHVWVRGQKHKWNLIHSVLQAAGIPAGWAPYPPTFEPDEPAVETAADAPTDADAAEDASAAASAGGGERSAAAAADVAATAGASLATGPAGAALVPVRLLPLVERPLVERPQRPSPLAAVYLAQYIKK